MWRAWLSQHVLPPLTVAIDIRLPEQLPATIAELCESLGCGERVLRAVLAVLRAQCVVSLAGDRCSLTATGEAFLLRRSGAFSGPFLMSSAACKPLHDRCKAALLAPDDDAQPTRTTEAWASGSLGSDEHRAQATLIFMHALHAPNAVRAAHTLLGALRRWCVPWGVDAAGRRLRLLDAGGGSGVYAVCLAKGCAELEVDIGELPEVAAAAEAMGYVPPDVAERVHTAALDLFGAWPHGQEAHDAHLLSSVLHDWDDAQCARLLRGSYAALPPGGVPPPRRLVVCAVVEAWWRRGAVAVGPVHGWFMHGAWMVRGWCVDGAWMVRAWCVHGACMVRAWCVHGACMVRAGVLLVHEVLIDEEAEAAGEAQLLVACLSLHMALYSRGRQARAWARAYHVRGIWRVRGVRMACAWYMHICTVLYSCGSAPPQSCTSCSVPRASSA